MHASAGVKVCHRPTNYRETCVEAIRYDLILVVKSDTFSALGIHHEAGGGMKSLRAASFTVAVLSLCLVGCATMDDVLKSKEEGTVKVYPVGTDKAWEIAVKALRWEGAETIEEHRTDGYMLTTIGANFVSMGSVVGVWVEPAGKGKSKVTAVTKRKMQTNVATGLTETTFHERFQQGVDIVKAGKPLPLEAP